MKNFIHFQSLHKAFNGNRNQITTEIAPHINEIAPHLQCVLNGKSKLAPPVFTEENFNS